MIIELTGLLALGFLSAIIAYLLGIGGGGLLVPAMVILFDYPVHEAIAISLIVMVASTLSLTSVNLNKGMVNIRFGIFLELSAIIGAVSGSLLSLSMDETLLSSIFAGIMFLTAFVVWRKSETKDPEIKEAGDGEFDREYTSDFGEKFYYHVKSPKKTAFVAIFAGLISGMLGLGGGIFKVPAMNIVSKMPIKVATATSNFMICFTAAAGAIPYLLKGYFSPASTGSMVLGVYLGSRFATGRLGKVQNKNIKIFFIFFLVFVALQMVYKGMR